MSCPHNVANYILDILMKFTGHRDIKCRENAVLALGNLCTNPVHVKRLVDVKCADALVAYSFPTTAEESVNAQFQAIAGLHGLSKHAELRAPLLREGGLEPLILGLRSGTEESRIEIRRESAAALDNMAIARESKSLIAKSGALPTLKDLLKSEDSICRNHASSALANLAELNDIHELLLDDCCLDIMCKHAKDKDCQVDTKRAIGRCLALFASNSQLHEHLLLNDVLTSLKDLIAATEDRYCERFGMLAFANLATDVSNHQLLLGTIRLETILSLAQSEDVDTLRSLAFALHSFSTCKQNHSILVEANAAVSLVTLLVCDDYDTSFQACLATKYLCTSENCRNTIAESKGFDALLSLASGHVLELKREVTGALRNMTLSDDNKRRIMDQDGMEIIAKLCRDSDSIVSHQACGSLANIAEREGNKVVMVKQGIILHLQSAVLTRHIPVLRETMRALANLSSASDNASDILASNALSLLIDSLRCNDVLCGRYAAMAMSNLSSLTEDACQQIGREGGINPLVSLVQLQPADSLTQQYAMTCLANVASYGLTLGGCTHVTFDHIKTADLDLRASVLLFVANLASNATSRAALEDESCIIEGLMNCLECNSRLVQMHALDALRGLSTSPSIRDNIISSRGLESLLALVHSDDSELKQKVLLTLCNLSLSGAISDRANTILQKVDIQLLIGFLCNEALTSHRMFGAMTIGNIASNVDFHSPILNSGALESLIKLSETNSNDIESRRCMALAICNLAAQPENRSSIVSCEGISSIMYLCHTNNSNDALVGLSTLRALATSDEWRRVIFEEGVLHVLSLALNTGCIACKREVSSVLALLSLNHENKFDLVRSDEIKEFMCLLNGDDAHCISLLCRCIGSICEVKELHPHVLTVSPLKELARLSSDTDPKVVKEVARCFANLSSNIDYHTAMTTPAMMKNLMALCCHCDSYVRRLSSLTISNLAINELNSALKGKNMLCVLNNIIDDQTVINSSRYDIESKCYACMAIGSLVSTDRTVGAQVVSMGIVPSLLQLMSVEDEQLNLCAIYLVDKLSLYEDTHPHLHDHRTISHLVNHKNATELPHVQTYSIGAIRRLCENACTGNENLMVKETTQFFAASCDLENIERCRQIVSGICHLALRHEAKSEILKNKVVMDSLIDLSKLTDVEVCRFAFGSLANIAEDNRFYGTIPLGQLLRGTSLLHELESEHTTIVREASRLIANLMSSIEFQSEILKEGGVVSILRVSLLPDYECVRNAALSLRKLAAHEASHGILFSQDGVGAIMRLAVHDDLQIRIQSASALRDISSNGDFQLAIKDHGVVGIAIKLACQPEIEIKILAIGILRHLSVAMNLKKELLNSATIDVLSDCVESYGNGALLFECASFIANLAEHAQNKVDLVQMGILHRLISLSKHDSVAVKQNSARALALISSTPRNHNCFIGCVLDALIGLLQCQEEETCRYSAAAIANIATNDEISAHIGNLGGIHPLILQLTSSEGSCQRNICHALSRLTTVEENKVSVLSCNGIDYLIPLCVSAHDGVAVLAMMIFCNLSTCSSHERAFVREDLIRVLGRIASGGCSASSKSSIMALCNLTTMSRVRDLVAKEIGLNELFGLIREEANVECRVYRTMLVCNLSSAEKHRSEILAAGGLHYLEGVAANLDDINLHRATLLTLCNISACNESHIMIAQSSLMQFVGAACQSRDLLCQRCAIMILSNIASSDETRNVATRGGGLQSAIMCLKGYDTSLQRFGLLCLANMSCDKKTQSQIVVHGGLHSIVNLSRQGDLETRECALLCLSNLCANNTNHSLLVDHEVLSLLASACKENQNDTALFALANLTSSDKLIHDIGADEGVVVSLIDLVRSCDTCKQCLAISALRRLASIAKNRDGLFHQGILLNLTNAINSKHEDVRREIASCLFTLSLSSRDRLDMAQMAAPMLMESVKSNDSATVKFSLGAIANVAEDSRTHPVLINANAMETIIHSLSHALTGIKREAIRSISNLLSSTNLHPNFIRYDGLKSLVQIQTATCEDCDCLAALSFSKLGFSTGVSNDGLKYMLILMKSKHECTRKYAASAMRNLSASSEEKDAFFKLGIPGFMAEVLNDKEKDLDVLAAATLRSLSCNSLITDKFLDNGILHSVIRSISKATVELKSQIAAIIANLSEHLECQPIMIAHAVVKAIGALSTIAHGDTLKVRYSLLFYMIFKLLVF